MIVAALEQQGIPVSYLLFEQHGFGKAENVIAALKPNSCSSATCWASPAGDVPDVDIRR